MNRFLLHHVVLLLFLALVLTEEPKCVVDDDCKENTFCYEGKCVDCFNCALLNRQPISSCAKSLNECDQCMDGYEEQLLTQRVLWKSCQEIVRPNGCFSDKDCLPGSYCFEQNTCVPCFDCTLYHRALRPNLLCARDIPDCGVCLEGFKDIPLTIGSRPKPCQLVTETSPLVNQSTEVHVNISNISLLGVGCLCFVAVVFTVFAAYKSRERIPVPSISHSEEGLPPPYTDQEANVTCEAESTVCAFYKESSNGDDCMARICRLPEYVTTQQQQRQQQDLQQRDQVDAVNVVIEQEEETVPCAWRPEDDTRERDGNSLLTFSGVLTLASSSQSTTDISVPHQQVCEENTHGEPSAKRRK